MSKYPDIKCYFFRNKHAQHTVERIVKDNLHLLPWWVGKLRIVMQGDADEEDVLATIETLKEYRMLNICIYRSFFSIPYEDQVHTIRHEFAHTVFAPVHNWIEDDLLPLLSNNQELAEHLASECSNLMEGCIQDIAIMLGAVHGEEAEPSC